jgi:hypothetical protein
VDCSGLSWIVVDCSGLSDPKRIVGSKKDFQRKDPKRIFKGRIRKGFSKDGSEKDFQRTDPKRIVTGYPGYKDCGYLPNTRELDKVTGQNHVDTFYVVKIRGVKK